MEGSYTFTCQLCRARLTLVGNLEAAESVPWAGGRGLLVPPHLNASVFDHTNVDESFIVLDGKRQGLPPTGGVPPSYQATQHQLHQHHQQQQQHQGPQQQQQLQQQQQQLQPSLQQGAQQAHLQQLQQRRQSPPQQLLPPQAPPLTHLQQQQQQQQQLLPPRGLEESFVVLGAASLLRPTPGSHTPYTNMPLPSGVSALHLQALQQMQHHHHQQQQQQQQPGGPGAAGAVLSGAQQPSGKSPPPPRSLLSQQQQQQQQQQQPGASNQVTAAATSQTPPPPPPPGPSQSPTTQPRTPSSNTPTLSSTSAQQQQQQQQQFGYAPPSASPPQPSSFRRGGTAPVTTASGGGGGGGFLQASTEVEMEYGSPAGGGGGGGPAGSGLDSKLQALAHLFELASTNTQVDHPLCMDCVGQLKEEMEAQIAEAEREIAAYSACLMQLEVSMPPPGPAAGRSDSGGSGGVPTAAVVSEPAVAARDAEEEYQLEDISRLEQERDQERARAEVLESELAVVASELASLSAAAADLDSLEERYWNDVNDLELLLRAHTEERGALLAKIDRAGQRLQLLKNTSVLYDAFKIWHDGPFGTISGFRLGRTPEVPVEWDEINAAWGQAVLLLHTMAQMCKLQFSQHRLLPMGSHPRVADKRATYDLFGPVSKLWSANYDRAMVAYLACLREFGEHAKKKDLQGGKPTQFNFPFPIDGDKVNNHTIKLTLNKDVRWTKALKFMLANLKIALQWCVKQDQNIEVPQLQHLEQEGPQ